MASPILCVVGVASDIGNDPVFYKLPAVHAQEKTVHADHAVCIHLDLSTHIRQFNRKVCTAPYGLIALGMSDDGDKSAGQDIVYPALHEVFRILGGKLYQDMIAAVHPVTRVRGDVLHHDCVGMVLTAQIQLQTIEIFCRCILQVKEALLHLIPGSLEHIEPVMRRQDDLPHSRLVFLVKDPQGALHGLSPVVYLRDNMAVHVDQTVHWYSSFDLRTLLSAKIRPG